MDFMVDKRMVELPFGEGKVAQPPPQPNLIFTRISTREYEALQDQIVLYRTWIKHAVVMLQNKSLKVPDDDGLELYSWGERGKELLDTYRKKIEAPQY